MNETDTYIKLYRKIVDWRWYKDSITKDVFLHLLLKANIKDCGFQRITVHRGELVTSYANIAFELGLSVRNVRTAIEHLKSTGEVTSKSYPKYQVIKILCYEQYQDKRQAECQSADNQPTSNRQASDNNQRIKECKNVINNKKENILKEKIPPSFEEVAAYCKERNNGIDAQQFIDFYEARGWLIGKAKMKDWKAAVRTWENRRKENGKEEKKVDRGFIPAGTVFD